jgi:hypothetical protein
MTRYAPNGNPISSANHLIVEIRSYANDICLAMNVTMNGEGDAL